MYIYASKDHWLYTFIKTENVLHHFTITCDRCFHLRDCLSCLLLYMCGFNVDVLCIQLQFTYEPRSEKTGLRGFRPGPTQTGLCSHRIWLDN